MSDVSGSALQDPQPFSYSFPPPPPTHTPTRSAAASAQQHVAVSLQQPQLAPPQSNPADRPYLLERGSKDRDRLGELTQLFFDTETSHVQAVAAPGKVSPTGYISNSRTMALRSERIQQQQQQQQQQRLSSDSGDREPSMCAPFALL